jgi:predicted ATPase
MIGHRIMGVSLMTAGDIAAGRAQLDKAIALYDPPVHRPLAVQFGIEPGVTALSFRGRALWLLGYPEAALVDAHHALKDEREIGHAVTLMIVLWLVSSTHTLCGNYMAAGTEADELVALADEKAALSWSGLGRLNQGSVLFLTGRASNAVEVITSGIATHRSLGSTTWLPLHLSHLAKAYSELGQLDNAWSCIGEAKTSIETTNERWSEAEVIVSSVKSRLSRLSRIKRKQRHLSSALSRSRVSSKPNPGNSAPQ